jgi:hypothetical protein
MVPNTTHEIYSFEFSLEFEITSASGKSRFIAGSKNGEQKLPAEKHSSNYKAFLYTRKQSDTIQQYIIFPSFGYSLYAEGKISSKRPSME